MKILKFRKFIFTISKLSPLGKGKGPSFEQIWIHFTLGWFVLSLVEIGPVDLEKKMKMWKKFTTTKTMDKFWSEKLTWAFG